MRRDHELRRRPHPTLPTLPTLPTAPTHQRVLLIELTVCFETSFDNAAKRKRAKYTELQQCIRDAGYLATLITLEVGSRGIIHHSGFSRLKKKLRIRGREFSYAAVYITGDHYSVPLYLVSAKPSTIIYSSLYTKNSITK